MLLFLAFEPGKLCLGVEILLCFFDPRGRSFPLKTVPEILTGKISGLGVSRMGGGGRMVTSKIDTCITPLIVKKTYSFGDMTVISL